MGLNSHHYQSTETKGKFLQLYDLCFFSYDKVQVSLTLSNVGKQSIAKSEI